MIILLFTQLTQINQTILTMISDTNYRSLQTNPTICILMLDYILFFQVLDLFLLFCNLQLNFKLLVYDCILSLKFNNLKIQFLNFNLPTFVIFHLNLVYLVCIKLLLAIHLNLIILLKLFNHFIVQYFNSVQSESMFLF